KYEPEAKNFIPGDNESFTDSGFNITEDTKIIVHGYFSSAKNFEHMVFAYLTAADHNIMLMDWSGLSKWCFCEHVLSIIEAIGKKLGVLLDFLVEKGAKLEKIHIIGHSLGAHIAGIGSVTCSKGRVGRITALDPARPGFSDIKNPDRLEKSRADVVDVIHTSAHTFGIAEPLGHYDFYPNGGQAPQPGCTGVSSEICSHSRAHYLFTESITTDVGYRGIKCSSWTNYLNGICTAEYAPSANMGSRLNRTSEEGTFYLKTGATCPYYLVKSGSASVKTVFTIFMILPADKMQHENSLQHLVPTIKKKGHIHEKKLSVNM
ncbi:Phospholipase A1 4, partial [Gryllus bimaculatus]